MRAARLAIPVLASLLAVVVAGQAAAAVATLASGGVRTAVKKVATRAPTAPPPAVLSTVGENPDVIVDAAGTAHVVWNEPVADGPDVTVYCRLPRAARTCEVVQRLVPPGADVLSDDADGPEVTAVNDQVAVLSHRYPQAVVKPGDDRSNDDDTLWLWSSDDGGRTFVGPGVVGIGTIGGDAQAFGPADNPSIGAVTGVATGGIRLTAVTGGRFQQASALLAEGDFADGRLAVANGVPSVAYHDLGTTAFVRTWTGQGDVNDAATWGPPVSFTGLEPEIDEAAGRLVLLNKKSGGSGDLELRDLASGAVRVVSRGQVGNDTAPIGHADGTVSAVWQGQEGGTVGIWRRERIPGTGAIRGVPTLVSTEVGSFLSADAADDGGGVAVRDTGDKRILLSGFGTTLPTGSPGLGGQPGGGAPPPDVAVACQKIQLGASVQVLLQDGCFLNARTGGVKVSEGTLRLNGLEIVPDAGVQLQIDVRAKTIRSTGTVTVLLRAPGIPDITLFRGRLDLSAAGKGAGATLGTFTEGLFRPVLLGFPLKGDIDFRLAPPDGVRIPVSLQLPKEFGDIRGAAELIADNRRGLVVDSLDFRADGVPLGPAMMRRLRVQYRATGGTTEGDCLRPPAISGAQALPDEWAGVFELELPPPKTGPTVCGSIRFGAPEGFRAATFRVDLPFPGIVLFPGLSLTSLGGGLKVTRPARVDGTFRLEVAGAGAGVSAAQMDGAISVVLSDPLVITGRGVFTAAGLRIGDGEILVSTDGYAKLGLTAGPSVGPFSVRTAITGFIDGPRRQFSLSGKGQVCVDVVCVDGSEAAISTKGVAICLPEIRPLLPTLPPVPPPRGAGLTWGDTFPDIWLLNCYASRYTVPDQRAAALGDPPVGEAGADLVAGGGATFRVTGAGGVPDVDLIGPDGQAVTPDASYPETGSATQYLAMSAPAPGRWTVRARPGSPLIAELAVSRARTAPRVTGARVTGRARARTLVYTARFGDDQAVTFLERGRAGTRVLGAASAGSRRLRFAPGPGPGGPRTIVAQLVQDGLVREEVVVARYTAPPPPRIARATALRARRAGTSLLVSWRPGPGAAAQRLVVRVPGGPLVSRLLAAGARRAVVPGIRGRRVVVSVTALGRDGRAGRPARVTLAPARTR
jgi:hypothetical protein